VNYNGAPCPPGKPGCYRGVRQRVGWVTAPDDTTTIGYFSLYKRGKSIGTDMCPYQDWHSVEYGLPFTRYCPDPSLCAVQDIGGLTRYLSKEVRTGFGGAFGWEGI
jgi:hypothetical protein